jgi:hypothetical protein
MRVKSAKPAVQPLRQHRQPGFELFDASVLHPAPEPPGQFRVNEPMRQAVSAGHEADQAVMPGPEPIPPFEQRRRDRGRAGRKAAGHAGGRNHRLRPGESAQRREGRGGAGTALGAGSGDPVRSALRPCVGRQPPNASPVRVRGVRL